MDQEWKLEDKTKLLSCQKANHWGEIIFFCLQKDCQQGRLLCDECIIHHQGHTLKTADQIQEMMDSEFQKVNHSAQEALRAFNHFRQKVKEIFDLIENSIINSMKIPQINEKLQQVKEVLSNNKVLTSYQLEDCINAIVQQNLFQDHPNNQLFSTSIQLKGYIEQFNNWIKECPKLQIVEEKCVFLKEINIILGVPFTHKINNQEYLVESITPIETVNIKSISVGRPQIINNQEIPQQEIHLSIVHGIDFSKVIYSDNFAIQFNSKASVWEIILKQPVLVLKNNIYTFLLFTTDNEGIKISDFRQQDLINPYLKKVKFSNNLYKCQPFKKELKFKQFIAEIRIIKKLYF